MAEAILWKRRFKQRIVKKLKGTSKETAKTRKELGVGILETPALDSIVDRELKDEDDKYVRIRKTRQNRYYLEEVAH